MSKLPRSLKPLKVIKALPKGRAGNLPYNGQPVFSEKRISADDGSNHKSVKTGTLPSILRQAGIALEGFLELL